MKTAAVLTCTLGLIAAGCLAPLLAAQKPEVSAAQIYQRATNVFDYAAFFKPSETGTNSLGLTLAPLILQQARGQNDTTQPPPRFGTLSLSNGAPALDCDRPAIYWDMDTVQLNGRTHTRCSYVWYYLAEPRNPVSAQVTHGAPGSPGPRFSPQGIRITLNSSGQPAIWEGLTDPSGAKVIYVSQSLEAAAAAEFGKPLAGRRFSIEQSWQAAPEAVVGRVIDDGPAVMGPIVYVGESTDTISTVICRCMPAQAKKLVSTRTYELLSWRTAEGLLTLNSNATARTRGAFPMGTPSQDSYFQASLRLPANF